MKKIILLLAAAFLACCPSAYAGNAAGGVFESYIASDMATGAVNRRDVKLDLNFSAVVENTEFKAELRAEDDNAREETYAKRVYLREAYVNHDIYFNKFINSLNIKFGRIIHTWGNADELKPVDILNPQDMTFLLFKQIKERKYGLFSLAATAYFTDNVFLELITLPEFFPTELNSRVFVIKQLADIAANPLYILKPAALPADGLKNMNYAARLGMSLFDIDAHLNYYNGYDHMPSMNATVTADTAIYGYWVPLKIAATPEYKRIEMTGLDFQRALFSGISVRGEGALFTKGKMFQLNDTATKANLKARESVMQEKKYAEYSLGADVVNFLVKNLYLNCQLNGSMIFDHEDSLTQDANINSVIAALEYGLFRDRLKLKVREFFNINDGAYAFGGEAAWKLSGIYEMFAGLWVLEGDAGSYYGQFSDKDMYYLGGRLTF